MFEKFEMLYLYVETPLHAGSGSSVGVVDLPIQRERVTHYPLVQASGIKGKLRAEADEWAKMQSTVDEAKKKVRVVFGPEAGPGASDHAGALSPGDARLLLFPVRSLVGVFAWTTSRNVLARLKRDLEATKKSVTWTLDNLPDNGEAWTVENKNIVTNGRVVLEEFTFTAQQHDDVKTIAQWLAENVLPQTDDYKYFREKLYVEKDGQKLGSLVILPEDAFRDFTQFATEVVTRIRIDQTTRTAAGQALWSEEHLPSDTLLYAPLHASRPRTDTNLFNGDDGKPSAAKVLEFVKDLFKDGKDRIQLGGDETVGRGIVKLRFGGQQ